MGRKKTGFPVMIDEGLSKDVHGHKLEKDAPDLHCSLSKNIPPMEDAVESSPTIEDKSGIVYLSTVPPYISSVEVERIMSAFGKVGRIFLRPKHPLPPGPSPRFAAKEGWVEFLNKKHAKDCVELLNGKTAGMRAPRQWRDSIWNLRYLHRFTWKDLTGYKFMRDFTAKKRLESEVCLARKNTQHYIEKVVMKKKKSLVQ